MMLKILRTFQHGTQRFTAGETRHAEPADAMRFVGAGWATPSEGTSEETVAEVIERARGPAVDLKPKSTRHGVSDRK